MPPLKSNFPLKPVSWKIVEVYFLLFVDYYLFFQKYVEISSRVFLPISGTLALSAGYPTTSNKKGVPVQDATEFYSENPLD